MTAAAASAWTSNVQFSLVDMEQFTIGLLKGAVEAEVPHGVECLRDAKHIWERIGGVVDEFRHATFDSVLHAVEDLGAIIGDVAAILGSVHTSLQLVGERGAQFRTDTDALLVLE